MSFYMDRRSAIPRYKRHVLPGNSALYSASSTPTLVEEGVTPSEHKSSTQYYGNPKERLNHNRSRSRVQHQQSFARCKSFQPTVSKEVQTESDPYALEPDCERSSNLTKYDVEPSTSRVDEILDTDPLTTAYLWYLVRMESSRPTRSKLPRRVKQPGFADSNLPGEPTPSTPSVGSLRTPTGHSACPSSTAETKNTVSSKAKSKRVGPYHKDFRTDVLAPRGIVIEKDENVYVLSHVVFNRIKQAGNREVRYTKTRKASQTSIRTEVHHKSVVWITRMYKRMKRLNMCETEFATYAKESFLRQDGSITEKTKEKVWRADRKLEMVAKPGCVGNWCAPPIVDNLSAVGPAPSVAYDFDIRPDCSYWLSLQAFNPAYHAQIEKTVAVMQGEISCPYVTVEFKRDDQMDEVAENQVAAAGALALFNRFLLRNRRLELQGKTWGPKRTVALRHYGLTMKGPEYTVWCLTPKLSKYNWTGCQMAELCSGNCTRRADVARLIDWVNEIHCWGLTLHGRSCEKDVKISIIMQMTRTGSRVSEFGPESEDDEGEQGQTKGDT